MPTQPGSNFYYLVVLSCRHRQLQSDEHETHGDMVRCTKCKGLSEVDYLHRVYRKQTRKDPDF